MPPKDTTRNLPPIPGSLTWYRSLVQPVKLPLSQLTLPGNTILKREESNEIIEVQSSIVASLLEFEAQKS